MTDFENQKTQTPKGKLFSEKTGHEKSPEPTLINGVPLQTLFEAKLRKQRKAAPHTMRRPSYMRYIEYS